jgi:hypothetical protein
MKKELKTLSAEELAILDESYPVSEDSAKLSLPRFGMLSKDITQEEGKGKNKTIKVLESAGTFYTEKDLGEVNEKTGKKVWTKDFLGEEVEVIIAYERKQLRKYDSSLKKFISSPLYDSSDQVVPLYLDKQVIKRGTPAELQSLYPALTQKGKPTSDLKEETVLFVVYEGELYQMSLSQSSKWSFKDYKKNINPSKVITKMSSVEETFGTNSYRKISFVKDRYLTQEEFDMVNESQGILNDKVSSDAQYFLQQSSNPALASGKDAELEELAASGDKKW